MDDEVEPTIEEDLESITNHKDILLDLSKNLDLEQINTKYKIKKRNIKMLFHIGQGGN